MNRPLVSVICLCYNQERFVREAIESVLRQTYPNVELIVVDDASTDNSVGVIREIVQHHPRIRLVALSENKGNCAAFNAGFRQSAGSYVIDLAADDVLLPDRIERGLADPTLTDPRYGVQFGDAELISEQGRSIGLHSDRFPHASVPSGDIYAHILSRYFICSPSMMMKRSVLERLGGYDETLGYEDFDFWVRSSREFHYSYLPWVLVRKRVVKGSMSDLQFKKGNTQQNTTWNVLRKARALNKSGEEHDVLDSRIRYELRKSLGRLDLAMAWRYYRML